MDPRKRIPSMFQRRLVLLGWVGAAVMVGLWVQMFFLSAVQGSARRETAMKRLDVREYLPTWRGSIVDRHGRTLALDVPSCDVAVEYTVIVGTWARGRAREEAVSAIGKSRWVGMSVEAREEEVQARVGRWRKDCEELWEKIREVGEIDQVELDRRLDAVKQDVQQTAAAVWEEQRKKEREKYGEEAAEEEFKAKAIREQQEAHVILPRVSDEAAFAFRVWGDEHPGMVKVEASRRREYPWKSLKVVVDRTSLPAPLRQEGGAREEIEVKGVGDHILGGMRDEVWGSDMARRPHVHATTGMVDLGWYRPGDSVGARGLEMVFEDSLRGKRGVKEMRKDREGEKRTEPKPGRDLKLTLDISLQARVQAMLSWELGLTRVQSWHLSSEQVSGSAPHLPVGTKLDAAAVVMEVETGEVLAMVSMPTVAMGEEMSEAERVEHGVWVNRGAEAVYPPGSILKPVILSAALTEGVVALGDSVECKGHYFEDQPGKLRCWIDRPQYEAAGRRHGGLGAAEALARSCNIFFYTSADRLGMERLTTWARGFGLGEPLDVGLSFETENERGERVVRGEAGGDVPSEEDVKRWRQDGTVRFRQILMGIGQGDVTWTPVQAANAYAMIARGGQVRDATLLMEDPRGSRGERAGLEMKAGSKEVVLEGLVQGVERNYGTSNHLRYGEGVQEKMINARGVKVWAKTGTAQAPARKFRWQDTNRDGRIDESDEATLLRYAGTNEMYRLDHAWFVGLVGPRGAGKPTHAIAVVVEYGGSGGKAAGPIGNQIIHALQAEGYLPEEGEDVGEILKGTEEPMPEDEHE